MTMTEKEFQDLIARHPELLPKQPFVSSAKPTKYHNRKVYIFADGYVSNSKDPMHGDLKEVFDSEKEYVRWQELLLLERQQHISQLHRQVSIEIQQAFTYHAPSGRSKKYAAITYKADFMYMENGICVVEDVKPWDQKQQKYLTTKDFNLKWKLLMYRYPEYEFRLF